MTRLLVMMCSVLSVGAAPPLPVAPKAKPPSTRPELLTPLARSLLHKRMERHGDSMLRLVVSVTLLQREKAHRFATEIATEPRLTRPMPGDDQSFNNGLPERLFVLQDELRSRAKTLATVAQGSNDEAMASSLGLVLQTCVSCHSLFLSPEATAAP